MPPIAIIPDATRPLTTSESALQQNLTSYYGSKTFYEKYGYPQYAGIYQAPTVPSDINVEKVEITESPAGLNIIFQGIPKVTPLDTAMKKYQGEPIVQAKYVTSQYAGTRTDSLRGNIGYSEEGSGFRQITWSQYTPEEQEALRGFLAGETTKKLTNLGMTLAAPLAFVAAPVTAATGAGINVAISQGIKSYEGKGLLTGEEFLYGAGEGAIFSTGVSAAFKGIGLIPKVGQAIVGSPVGRVGVMSGIGSTVGYVTSGFRPEGALYGAGYGALFGVGSEIIGYGIGKAAPRVKASLQPRMQQSVDLSYRKAVESFTKYKPSIAERLYLKSGWAKIPSLATEIVGAGEASPIGFKVYEDMPYAEGKSVKAFQGKYFDPESYFWDMPTPKTTQLYTTKTYGGRAVGSRVKTWAGEKLIKSVSGGMSYALIQEQLQEIRLKPLERNMPYIPSAPSITEVAAPSAQGVQMVGTAVFEGLKPKVSQVQRLSSRQTTMSRLRADLIQASSVIQEQAADQTQALATVQIQGLKQQQKQEQRTQQVQRVVTMPYDPLKTIGAYVPMPKGHGGGGSGGKGVFGGALWGKQMRRHINLTKFVLGLPQSKKKSKVLRNVIRRKQQKKKRGRKR